MSSGGRLPTCRLLDFGAAQVQQPDDDGDEIAADLFIGLTTAKTDVASLLTKIGARNRVEIAMWAYDIGRVGD